ncbi:MAG: hypothetical protein ACTSWW_06885 [Promethearchaeota archaeon]
MACKIWFPSNYSPKNRYVAHILLGWKGISGAMYSYYGILLLNTVVKTLFGGLLELSNYWFYLMGLILLTLLAGILLVSGVFKAPTWHTLFSFLAIFGFTIYYFEFFLEVQPGIDKFELVTIPMLLSIGVFLGTTLLTLPIRIMKMKNEKEKKVESSFEFHRLWDISIHVDKWITKKTLGILWVLFTLESFLLLEGYTLLYWVGLL